MTTSGGAKVVALCFGAFVAWTLTTAFDIGPILVGAFVERLIGVENPTPMDPVQLRNIITLYAAFGLPISFPVVLLIGYPTWRLAERKGQTRWRDALRLGALAGLFLGLVLAAYIFVYGLHMLASSSSFDSWTYGYQVMADGMPTPLGWAFQLIDLVCTVVTGAVAGLATWAVPALIRSRKTAP